MDFQKKINSVKGFFQTMDKKNLGVVPATNFAKVTKMFGIPVNSNDVTHQTSNGMVDY